MVQLSVFKNSTWIYVYFYILRYFFNPCIQFNGGVFVAHIFSFLCSPIMCLHFLNSVLWCPLRFPHNNDVRFFFTSSCLEEGSCLIYVIYACFGIVVSNTYCVFVLLVIVLCLVYLVLPVSLDGSFVIASSVFSNIYLLNTLLILISHG